MASDSVKNKNELPLTRNFSITDWGKRDIYLGENFSCIMTQQTDRKSLRVEIINLTSVGITVVPSRDPKGFEFTGVMEITFLDKKDQNFFTVLGTAQNKKQEKISGRDQQVIEILIHIQVHRTLESFSRAIPGDIFHCRTYVRPQVTALDPFFFQETIYFQVHALTPMGIDLVVSARCKSLFPNQPLLLKIYVPGRGEFEVEAKVSDHRFFSQKNRIRFFARFTVSNQLFLEAVSEYLILFSPLAMPSLLRKAGFPIGNLEQAFQLAYERVDEQFIAKKRLVPSILGWPSPIAETEFQSQCRGVTCKLGQHLVGACNLLFYSPKKKETASKLKHHGHSIPSQVMNKNTLEIIDFHISSRANVSDFFIPFLKHIVRIASQAEVKFILIECTSQLVPLLRKVGFKPFKSKLSRQTGNQEITEYHLLGLLVDQVLTSNDSYLTSGVWEKVFKDISLYLNKESAPAKAMYSQNKRRIS